MATELEESTSPGTRVPGAPASPAGVDGADLAVPPEEDATAAPATTPRKRRRLLSRRTLLVLGIVILAAAAYVGYRVYQDNLLYVSTDNAEIDGDMIPVGAMNAGRVDSIFVKVGSQVHKGQVLARVELPSLVSTAQNGQPKLDFLGASDTRVDVQAPTDGVVVALPEAVGSSVQAGQSVVTLVDPSQLWVNANIDETSIDRVQVGDPVVVHVDALHEDVPGRVEAITPATAASFSLLPQSNSSGTFNKVTQLVPVRIGLQLGNQPALLGSSVEVQIRVE